MSSTQNNSGSTPQGMHLHFKKKLWNAVTFNVSLSGIRWFNPSNDAFYI
jgi:hypothetical protein